MDIVDVYTATLSVSKLKKVQKEILREVGNITGLISAVLGSEQIWVTYYPVRKHYVLCTFDAALISKKELKKLLIGNGRFMNIVKRKGIV